MKVLIKELLENNNYIKGFLVAVIIFILGFVILSSDILVFRFLIGITLGYALARASMGFAGCINRAYKTGSTSLLKGIVWIAFFTAIMNIALFFNNDPTSYRLWINPINIGLVLGAILFGFGASLSFCCASGVLVDMISSFSRAFITLLFFGMGVFLGFPIQSASWVKNSIISSSTYEGKGVFLPDLFNSLPINGYIGTVLLMLIFVGIIMYIAYLYEERAKKKGIYKEIEVEKEQQETLIKSYEKKYTILEKLFIKPWTFKTGGIVLIACFLFLMSATKAGWGASTPFGIWFGKLLMLFGFSAESLANYTGKTVSFFTTPFLKHQVSIQNLGIVLGALIYISFLRSISKEFFNGIKKGISTKSVFLFALGGFSMGIGTRLANGCNVGALYTPIANLSLSGWIFLAFLGVGAIIGNYFLQKIS